MSTEDSPEGTVEAQGFEFTFRYGAPSEVKPDGQGSRVALVGNDERGDLSLKGRIKDPLRFREAMSVIYAIVGSDYRYVPKDRTAYLAYIRQQQAAPKKSAWDAQKSYFDWIQRNDPSAWLILDPIISVKPDGVFFEVFSKDESTYACLQLDMDGIDLDGPARYGTTNIDFSKGLFDSMQKMRGYRETRLNIGKEAVAVATAGEEILEKKVKVPDTWIRAFLQVQSAATLPHTSFSLAPIDFYNILRWLRFNADKKKQGRGLRIELIPGEAPRLVLEPWEQVFKSSAGIYRGRSSEVVKVWGRRRLMLMRRLLPFIDHIDVHVLGSGLPSFYVFRAGPIKLTIGLSGWTAINWSQIVSFDLLLPRERSAQAELDKALELFKVKHIASVEEVGAHIGTTDDRLLSALQLGCQQGLLMYDIESGRYRYRPLTEQALPWDRLEFRNDNERLAHDLLAKGAVSLESENRVHGLGIEIVGKVMVAADQRDYRPEFVAAPGGQLRKVKCSCRYYRQHGLKNGPCPHLVALCLFHAQQEAKRRELAKRGELRETTTSETKTYAKRDGEREEVYQLSLSNARMRVRWGQRGETMRVQSLVFNTVDEARSAYYKRVDGLESKGYLDATEGGVA